MNNFALCPLQRGYTPEVANNLLEQQLMGGFARQRVQFVNNVHTVTASVMLNDKGKQQYFWSFWRIHQTSPQPFLWRLMIDDFEMTTYVCQFVAGSLNIGERDGKVYSVSFGLRIKPNNTGKDFDPEIIDIWNNGDPRKTIDLLDKLVNKELPQALGGI